MTTALRVRNLCLFFGIVVAAAMTDACGAAEFIVADGTPRAEIVISETPTRTVKLAAEELQTYVEKITGGKLPIVTMATNAAPVKIYIGRSEFTDAQGIQTDDLKHGAFRIRSGPNWLALIGQDADFVKPKFFLASPSDMPQFLKDWDTATGEHWGFANANLYKEHQGELKIWARDQRGSLNAVYEFLRRQGVRWYLPDELGEIVPTQKSLELPVVDDTIKPDFAFRYPYQYARMFGHEGTTRVEALWQMRLGWNLAPDVMGDFGMSLSHGINPITERPEVRAAHPEFYMLTNGQRDELKVGQARQCLSSPGLFQRNVKYIRKMYELVDAPMVSIMPQDGYVVLCQCDLCQGKGTLVRGWEGQISDYVWDYVNRVAAEVYKTHPERKVSCCAYGAYLLPPEKIEKLSPNIVVGICQTRATFLDPAERNKFEELRAAWMEKIPAGKDQFITYDYYLTGRPFTAPHLPNFYPKAIAHDLKSLKGISIGDFIEVWRDLKGIESLVPDHLNLYVTSRCWWDADLDIDALLAEYYREFYGPAADEMKAFVDYSEAHLVTLKKDAAQMSRAMELFAAAKAKANPDTIYGKRLAWMADYFQPMHDLRDQLAKGREDVPEAAAFLREAKDLKLDGKLDEPFWDKIWVNSLSELETGRQPYMGTSFRMAWTEKDIVFGVRCEDRDTKQLAIGARKNEDPAMWSGDCIEVLLETQSHAYYQLALNPSGALIDLDRDKGLNTTWNSAAQAACHIGDGFWSAEIRIPVVGEQQSTIDPNNGVAGRQPSSTYPWYFNVCRQRVRPDESEYSAFSPTGAASFHINKKFGRLIVR